MCIYRIVAKMSYIEIDPPKYYILIILNDVQCFAICQLKHHESTKY